jgi:hypothetical protein
MTAVLVNPVAERHAFRMWLRKNRRAVRKLELPEMLARYGGDISVSAAYRAAIAEGLRGKRCNGTRYAPFWATINWRLPDSVLSAIWGVMRGNIRQRRVRLGVGDATYDGRLDMKNPAYLEEVDREKRRARRFEGPRPR